MFTKLLYRLFIKRFKKLSPEEKQNVRELVNEETKSEQSEKKPKKETKKRRTKKMADEKEVKQEKEETTSKVESENTSADKKDTTKTVDKEEKVEKTEEVEDKGSKTEEAENAEEVEEPTEQVEETSSTGAGLKIKDIATKDFVHELIDALEAKLESVVKENTDLKEKITAKDDEINGMKDKYENGDFGGFQKQGIMEKNKDANSKFETYDEYVKRKGL